MKLRTPDAAGTDLVPLGERVRYLRAFRLCTAAAAIVAWLALPEMTFISLPQLAAGTGGYLLLTLSVDLLWRFAERRVVSLFGATLIVDGVYLAWIGYLAFDVDVPLRFLVVVHVIAVALLASFRTGLKLALWHSLLLVTVYHAHEAGLLSSRFSAEFFGADGYAVLVGYVALYWVVAITVASFASVNERELRRRRYDLEALARVALQLEAASDAAAAARALTAAVVDELGFDRVALFDARDERLHLIDQHGAAPRQTGTTTPQDGRVLREIAAGQETRLASRVRPEDDPLLERLMPGHRNLILAPLIADHRTVAVLVCEHGLRRGSRIERRVVGTLERFVSQAALALYNAWLHEQLAALAATDGLTGVANRRTFEADLGREISRSSRSGEPVALVMVDIDRFKALNDTFGHLTGDLVLQQVAGVLDSEVRAVDTVARYGGEEFGVILPGLDTAGAAEVAERLRALVAGAETETPVTASFGVAS